MKSLTVSVILLFAICFGLKLALEKETETLSRLPTQLKPLEAGYESDSLKRFAFGFDSLISSLLWVQVLQRSRHTPVEKGEVSWEFAQMDAITTLDPAFDQAYAYGSIFLSFFRRDQLGGRLILEKWSKRFPSYWRPIHMLGMHHYEELGDYAAAAPLILRASMMAGAPKWLNSLGLRLLSDTGSLISAFTTAVEMSRMTKDPIKLSYLYSRIRALNYNLQRKTFESRFNGEAQEERSLASASLASLGTDEKLLKDLLEERFQFRWDAKQKRAAGSDPALEALLGKTGIFAEPSAVKRIK